MSRHGPEEGSQNNLSDDIGWNFATMATNRHNAVCMFCKKIIKGGITRVKEHLAGKRGNVTPCPDVPREVREQMMKHLQESKDKRKDKQKMKEELEFHLKETVVRDPRYVDLDDDSDSDPEMTFERRESVTQYQFEESHKRKSVHVHTHLKKRLKNNQISQDTKKHSNAPMEFIKESSVNEVSSTALFSQLESKTSKFINLASTPRLGLTESPRCAPVSSQHSKGPWTLEEDQMLISYIEQNGHGDWRALPKLAGLLRCGKSCRLRWTNYLRPDIKRGNFSKEEEETIIKLHEMLGNRWSAIAARLPGRTDNEIKNVWHTHLKKRLKNNQTSQGTKKHSNAPMEFKKESSANEVSSISLFSQLEFMTSKFNNFTGTPRLSITESPRCAPVSPQHSCSELSTVTDSSAMTMVTNNMGIKHEEMDHSSEYFPEIDESFWSEELPAKMQSDIPGGTDELHFQIPLSPANTSTECVDTHIATIDNDMDFWYNVFLGAGELPELPEF